MPKQQTDASQPRFFDRIQLAWSTARYVDGIWVGSWRTPSDLRRAEDALLLIKQYSPLQYSRVVRDLSRIWVSVLSDASAEYNNSLNACMLDERYVANSTVERIASTIVHEATHARLERLRITYREELRSRIETICFRRELAFVAKLPDSTELQNELIRSVEWYSDKNEWFSDTNFRERYNQSSVETLRYLGGPEWFIRVAPKIKSVISGVRRFCTSLVD